MAEPVRRILYIEDDELDRIAFTRYVKLMGLNYDFDMVDSVSAAKTILKMKQYDTLLVDYNLKDGTAFDIIKDIDTCAIILLTGLGDEQIAAQSIKFGAFDYLIKDTSGIYLTRLPETIEQAILEKTASIELSEYHTEIEKLVQIRTLELRREIEERKRVELELQQMNLELEDRVQQRTEMLNQSVIVLSKAQNQLIESERIITVSRLMQNLSQKINTPIGTNITLSSFLLEENQKIWTAFTNGTLKKADFEEYLQQIQDVQSEIQNNLNISAALVERFKEYNRRKLMDKIMTIPLAPLIQEVIQLLNTKLNELNITVSVEIDENLSPHNYPSVLKHIFFNLIMHSITNTDPLTPQRINIRSWSQEEHLLISYMDTLGHLSSEDLNKVFDTFYILNYGEDSLYLELNTVYTLIQEIEKGEIIIVNSLENGNHFMISMPLVLVESITDISLSDLIHSNKFKL